MTDRTWIGGGNNNARNPNDWSPTGAPQSGDTLSMINGTMNVRDDDLAGNAVHVGDPITGGQDTFNLSHHAVLAVDHDLWRTDSEWRSHGQQLSGSQSNDQSGTLNGVHAIITPDVLGIGSFTLSNAQGVGGFLEFGRSVSSEQSVSVGGDPGRDLASGLQIDHPREFHAAVAMRPQAVIDLVGLAKADSYTFENDMLAIFAGHRRIDQLKLTNDGTFEGQPHDLVVSKSGTDVFLTQAGLTSPPIGSTMLPLHT